MNTADVRDASRLQMVAGFLYREARYMDGHEYDAWLSLWESDLVYWVPCNENESDPDKRVSLIYDDRASLLDRVGRLKGKHAFAQRPKSRLLRAVSNIEVSEDRGDELIVESVVVIGEVRNCIQNQYLARCIHVLVPRDESFSIKSKKVMLLNNDAALGNLTFLL